MKPVNPAPSKIVTPPSPARTDCEAAAPAKINSQLIDGVVVTLEAYLGSARMTVAELNALKPDAVVSLDVPLSQAVEVRLNGVAVARGELVAAGDRFAVRILEISK
jgi:flagellar motor switch protein FliN